jgi:hypothetical protein
MAITLTPNLGKRWKSSSSGAVAGISTQVSANFTYHPSASSACEH